MLTFVFVAGPRSTVEGVFVAGHWVGSGVLRHADVARSRAVGRFFGMLAYDEPCGEVLRHAGVGRVQVEAGSWRRWGSGVWGAGRGGRRSWCCSSVDVPVITQRQVPAVPLR